MEKTRRFNHIKLSPEKLKEIYHKWLEKTQNIEKIKFESRSIDFKDYEWKYDNDEEFFADFNKDYYQALFVKSKVKNELEYHFFLDTTPKYNTILMIQAPTRAEIEDVYYVLEKDWEKFKIPEMPAEPGFEKPTIFIGHGKNQQWRDLKDHLSDKHNYKVIAFETGARAGHTIRDVLEDMLTNSSFAILVMTGEDETKAGGLRARQNVIHELGLFQGNLGFSKAIVLFEEDTDEFSNLHGIQQIRFAKGNIKETFGEILATIKREFND